ncbi:hypothetical protein Sjap_013428 [Stephania japonica]|uniref:PRONE domain-containing protein n=1 Tax=Stephania japonica TaxID=461633 RepID=A0AAP0J0D0_9MAGN
MEKVEMDERRDGCDENGGESEWFTVSDGEECGKSNCTSEKQGSNVSDCPICEPEEGNLLGLGGVGGGEVAQLVGDGDGFGNVKCDVVESGANLIEYRKSCLSSSSSEFLTSEGSSTVNEDHIGSENSSSSPAQLGWPIVEPEKGSCEGCANGDGEKLHLNEGKLEKPESKNSEMQMMKERFAKLLLGEDMSGRGEGVCTALAISNAITNLCATVFGQVWRLEPLPQKKKSMWRREMEWLLSVSDHVVEFLPSWQTFPDGSKLEVMTCRPRSDLYINLPALRKLDHMLLEILDSFRNTEFWYVDQGILASDASGSVSFHRPSQRQEEKWWLPIPCVPPGGLHESSRRQLLHRRESTNQILKAVMAINSTTLDEMAVPESYLESLPKNGKASLGDVLYRYITSDQFSPECLLDCLTLSSEHQVLEIANRVEASIYIWRQRAKTSTNRPTPKSSWEMVKDLMIDTEKWEFLAERAESLLFCLKQRYPGLSQTTLDMCKIQYNKDVGKSMLESYSRVLESLASNIMARIDDLLYVDDMAKFSDQFSSVTTASVITGKSVTVSYPIPVSGASYAKPFTPSNFSTLSPIRPFLQSNNKTPHLVEHSDSDQKTIADKAVFQLGGKSFRSL